MHRARLTVLIFALAASCLPLAAKDFLARVVGVHDGDTITVLRGVSGKKQWHIRLSGIDAPEIGQAFGKAAKQALSDLVFGKTVTIVENKTDDYGRLVADVYVDGEWVNLAMVKQGFAWRYTHYSNDAKLGAAEAHARQAHLGLWEDKNPVPPWDWRHHEERRRKK